MVKKGNFYTCQNSVPIWRINIFLFNWYRDFSLGEIGRGLKLTNQHPLSVKVTSKCHYNLTRYIGYTFVKWRGKILPLPLMKLLKCLEIWDICFVLLEGPWDTG